METPQTNKLRTDAQPGLKPGKIFIITALAASAALIVLASFAGGVFVGFHKAKFSCDWGKNYEMNFMGPRIDMRQPGPAGFIGPMMRKFEGRDFRNPHGVAGTIISVSDGSLVIKDRDDKENAIAVNDKTIIKSKGDDIELSDLKVDDKIVVIGQPGDEGVINASLIRVFNGS